MDLGSIGGWIKVAYDWLVNRRREEESRKKSFKVLLDELHNIKGICDTNTATILKEMSELHPTAPLFFSTPTPLSTLGWESLRSSGISATLEVSTRDRLYAIYNQIASHNEVIALRRDHITSDTPKIILPMYIKDDDGKLLAILESIRTEIGIVEPDIGRRADC